MGRPYVSSYFSPKRGSIDVLAGFIDRTNYTLDIAVYALTHPTAADALIRAQERGVAIRLLTDKVQASSPYSKDEELEAAGINLRRDKKTGSMHAKYAIADAGQGDAAVLGGSFNWTKNADEKNVEHLTIIRLKYVVRDHVAHFEEIWELNAPEE